MAVSAEEVLREMAGRALQRLGRGRRSASDEIDRPVLRRTTSELQATATVLVLLDLIAEERAEQLLSAHRQSLDGLGITERGVSAGELTLRSTSAYGFQAARRRQLGSLRHRPLSVAAPAAHVALLDFDLGIDWLVVARGGVRGRGTISTSDGRLLPTSHPEMSVPCVDDGGKRYELRVTGGSRVRRISPTAPPDRASTGAEITTESPVAPTARFVELRPPGSSPVRIELHTPQAASCGESEPDWPTPAEWFLAHLLPDAEAAEPGATFGVGLDVAAARAVGTAVTDALLAVGALPAGSPLLHHYPQRPTRWTYDLASRYAARVAPAWAAASRPRQVIAVGVPFPLRQAVAVLDAVVVMDHDVWLHAYFFPDTTGEYWPVSPGVMDLYATDDLGYKHYAVGASYWATPDHEGFGDRWLWPPLDPRARRLRFTLSTPWEAAWAEVDLR